MITFEEWFEELVSGMPNPEIIRPMFEAQKPYMQLAFNAGMREKNIKDYHTKCPICGEKTITSRYAHCSLDCADEAMRRAKALL